MDFGAVTAAFSSLSKRTGKRPGPLRLTMFLRLYLNVSYRMPVSQET